MAKAQTYICAVCGGEYEFVDDWEDTAVAEMKELWGEDITTKQCNIVCDDCFQLLSIKSVGGGR